MEDINNTLKEYTTNYIEIIDKQLRNNKNKIAIVDYNHKYTYNDLLKNIYKYK